MTDFAFAPQLCACCGGRCCRETPGVWVDPPRFFGAFDLLPPRTPADLEAALARLSLAWRDLGGVLVPLPQSDEDGCRLLGPAGCRLSEEERPCQCLALAPNPDTLRQDELLCELPDEFRLIQARRNWGAYWQELEGEGG